MGTWYVRADIIKEQAAGSSNDAAVPLAPSTAGLTDVYVYSGVRVSSAFADGVLGTASLHDALIHGDVSGDASGVKLGDNRASDSRERVIVYEDASVSGMNVAGVSVTAFKSQIDNYGEIQGGTFGVYVSAVSASTRTTIRNYGDIFGGTYGVGRALGGGDTETILFRNMGFVQGDVFAYWGGDTNVAVDHIVNTGTFDGDVALGGGADVYDARKGGVVNGIVLGESGDDTFYGNSALAETFDGGEGADKFFADTGGLDTFRGGNGGDVYYIAPSSSHTIVEAANGTGRDVIVSTATFNLNTVVNVEDATLAEAAGAGSLAGNAGNNILTGNSFGNTLDGRAGVDTMVGGGGDDTYYVDNSADRITETLDNGRDVVFTSASYTLSNHVEDLYAQNTAGPVTLTGNALNNRIGDDSRANVLNGMLGDDQLVLSQGADTVVFSTALGPTNVDTVFSFDADIRFGPEFKDTFRLDNAVFTGLVEGDLPTSAFRSFASLPTQADLESDDRIIQVTSGDPSGFTALYFDRDGNGSAAMVKFALLVGGNASSDSFEVI